MIKLRTRLNLFLQAASGTLSMAYIQDLADAFRGDVEVQVTVENQQVTDISIFSYCDTEEYFSSCASCN